MPVFCFECEKVFSTQSNFNRHKREVHGDESNEDQQLTYAYEKYLCLEGCKVSFRFIQDLRNHLHSEHNIQFTIYKNYCLKKKKVTKGLKVKLY